MLYDDMLRFVFVYDARFADALLMLHVEFIFMSIEKATKAVVSIQNPFAFHLWITLIDDDCFWTSDVDSNHEIPFLVSNVGQRKVHEGHYNVTT